MSRTLRSRQHYASLRQFCTSDNQVAKIDALCETPNMSDVAKKLGCARTAVAQTVTLLETRATELGYSPEHDMTNPVPDGFIAAGVSTLYDKQTGEPKLQWVRAQKDKNSTLEALRLAVDALVDEIKPAKAVKPPTWDQEDELVNVYTITDFHIGMLAWHREGGDDWDMNIAEQTLRSAFQMMVDTAPPARKAIVSQLGDFLHYDGFETVTPISSHTLDSDGRFPKMVEVAIRTLRFLIDCSLEQHEEVVVVISEGNHDQASSVWMRKLLVCLYESEPRVTIEDTELPYTCLTHGETMIGFHHGHKRKGEQLVGVFAAQYPEQWGQTKYRFIHWGHFHSKNEVETNGATVIRHPTLAARDAYASRGAFFGNRRAIRITYHKRFGEWGTGSICPEMFIPQ